MHLDPTYLHVSSFLLSAHANLHPKQNQILKENQSTNNQPNKQKREKTLMVEVAV